MTASSSALGELCALAVAGGDLKALKALATEAGTHTQTSQLDARLAHLGYKTLGSRLRVKDALMATPDAELPLEKIEWSKPDVYPESEGVAEESDAGRPPAETAAAPSADEELPLHYVVAGERFAVRDRPSRSGKALDVLRKGAVVIVRTIKWEQRPDKVWESWIRLEDGELTHLSPPQPPERVEAWALAADADDADEKAGRDAADLLTPVDSRALYAAHGKGLTLFDPALAPSERAAASVPILQRLVAEEEVERAEARAKWEAERAERARRAQEAAERAVAERRAARRELRRRSDEQVVAEAHELIERLKRSPGTRPTAREAALLKEAEDRLARDPGELDDAVDGEKEEEEAEEEEEREREAAERRRRTEAEQATVSYSRAAGPARPPPEG